MISKVPATHTIALWYTPGVCRAFPATQCPTSPTAKPRVLGGVGKKRSETLRYVEVSFSDNFPETNGLSSGLEFAFEQGVFGGIQIGVGLEDGFGKGSGAFNNLLIRSQVANA